MSVRRLSVALFAVSGFLLTSWGGAIFAAPLTLPLMYLAVRRHPTSPFRWAGGIIAGLTALEVAWAGVYVFQGEVQPAIWLVPVVAGVAVLGAFLATGHAVRQARRSSRSPSRNQISTPSSRSR